MFWGSGGMTDCRDSSDLTRIIWLKLTINQLNPTLSISHLPSLTTPSFSLSNKNQHCQPQRKIAVLSLLLLPGDEYQSKNTRCLLETWANPSNTHSCWGVRCSCHTLLISENIRVLCLTCHFWSDEFKICQNTVLIWSIRFRQNI